jgi:hypothetical protein
MAQPESFDRHEITQRELHDALTTQDVNRPQVLGILARYHAGARIERGELTINPPPFDSGPFVVRVADLSLEQQRLQLRIEHHLAMVRAAAEHARRTDGQTPRKALSEFRFAALEIRILARQAFRSRCNFAEREANWQVARSLASDWVGLHLASFRFEAAARCLAIGLFQAANHCTRTACMQVWSILSSAV